MKTRCCCWVAQSQWMKLDSIAQAFAVLAKVVSHSTLSALCSGCGYFSHFIDGDIEALRNDALSHPVSSGAGSNLGSQFQIIVHPTPLSAPFCLTPHSYHCGLPGSPTPAPPLPAPWEQGFGCSFHWAQQMYRCVTVGGPTAPQPSASLAR